MSNLKYIDEIKTVTEKIDEQADKIKEAAKICADVIYSGKMVHVFGTGYSSIAVQDIFPRNGSNLGWHPILDPKLIWMNVKNVDDINFILEKEEKEGYIESVLNRYSLKEGEAIVIFSQSGANACAVDAALYAKKHGLKVIGISSYDNYVYGKKSAHSTSKKLYDIADIYIDNACPLRDALIKIDGYPSQVGAGSTVAALLAGQSILTETAFLLNEMGHKIYTLETQFVESCPKDWTRYVFGKYWDLLEKNK